MIPRRSGPKRASSAGGRFSDNGSLGSPAKFEKDWTGITSTGTEVASTSEREGLLDA
jgi:hypothetical protein